MASKSRMTNGTIRATDRNDRFDVVAAVENLTDEEYMITGVWGAAMQSIEGVFARGREYSLTVRARF